MLKNRNSKNNSKVIVIVLVLVIVLVIVMVIRIVIVITVIIFVGTEKAQGFGMRLLVTLNPKALKPSTLVQPQATPRVGNRHPENEDDASQFGVLLIRFGRSTAIRNLVFEACRNPKPKLETKPYPMP